MLAVNHVTLATAVTFAGSIYLDQPFFLPFIAFVVFASLLPDVDHPGSEISNYFPLVNRLFGHRAITHSILGTSIFMGAMYLLVYYFEEKYSYGASIAFLVFAFIGIQYLGKLLTKRLNQLQNRSRKAISEKQIKFSIRLAVRILDLFLILLAFLIWKEQFREEILVLLGVGYVGHILGDFLTKDGIPLFWPLKIRSGLRLFRTGSGIETFIGVILLGVNVKLIIDFWNQFNLGGSEYWFNYLPFLA